MALAGVIACCHTAISVASSLVAEHDDHHLACITSILAEINT